jgi:hypothetical protein
MEHSGTSRKFKIIFEKIVLNGAASTIDVSRPSIKTFAPFPTFTSVDSTFVAVRAAIR